MIKCTLILGIQYIKCKCELENYINRFILLVKVINYYADNISIWKIVVFGIHAMWFLECSVGFYGTDCATKCIYPTYGEDCQSRCQCSDETCHFSKGCLPNTGAVTEYQELSTSHAHLSIELHVNKDNNKIEYVFVIKLRRGYFIYSTHRFIKKVFGEYRVFVSNRRRRPVNKYS